MGGVDVVRSWNVTMGSNNICTYQNLLNYLSGYSMCIFVFEYPVSTIVYIHSCIPVDAIRNMANGHVIQDYSLRVGSQNIWIVITKNSNVTFSTSGMTAGTGTLKLYGIK